MNNSTSQNGNLTAHVLQSFHKLSHINWEGKKDCTAAPCFFRFLVEIPKQKELFLSFPADGPWTRGIVFVNGVNLGRFSSLGPQRTMYVMRSLLKKINEFIIFETDQLPTQPPILSFASNSLFEPRCNNSATLDCL